MNEILVNIFRFLHFLGLASLIGGLLVQTRTTPKTVNPAVLHGALTQLVTGVVLVILSLSEIDHLKITVKLGILIVILVIVFVRRKTTLASGHYIALLALSVINVGIAVFWNSPH